MSTKPFIMDHPLIQHKLSWLRDKNTGSKEFRALVNEIASLMCYEATRDLPLEDVEIETPMGPAVTKVISGRKLAFVPILRAGMGMLDGMLALLPAAKVGHIGLYRDEETATPVEYYCKLPTDIAERDVIVLDPMLATGGSAASSSCASSPPRRAWRPWATPTPMSISTAPLLTSASTSRSTSFPDWATPGTASTGPSKAS